MKRRIIAVLISVLCLCGCGDVWNKDTTQTGLSLINDDLSETTPESEAKVISAAYEDMENTSVQTSELISESSELIDSAVTTSVAADTATEQSVESASLSYTELTEEMTELSCGLNAVMYNGDYKLDDFINSGGASDDTGVAAYVMSLLGVTGNALPNAPTFGCSTISSRDSDGNSLFGRNFDWNTCNALIIKAVPQVGYASVCTANMDFAEGMINISGLPDNAQALVGIYSPLDGMNEKGLCVSVNMIQDYVQIDQDTEKTDITTTTAVRLMLDKAATVDEAIELLNQYDLHNSMGLMIHFAIADAHGKSVVVEYINNEMHITETPVVTNFYLTAGDKYGIGTEQSHERYEILSSLVNQKNVMTMEDMRDALDSVSKDNFASTETTEWSIVFNQGTGEVHYYHREDYSERYTIKLDIK